MGVWALLIGGLYIVWRGYRAIIEREIIFHDIFGNVQPDSDWWGGSENIYGFWAVIVGWFSLLTGVAFTFMAVGHLLGFDMGLRTNV